jgi:hypothetical protein
MNALFDFFSPEAGQRRRAALNEFGRDIGYYVPPELRGILGLVAEATPTATIDRASAASMRAADPTRTASQRIGDVGNMLSEVAGVVAPAAVVNRAAMPAAQALQEGLLGFSVGAQDAGRAIVDRLNQPGPVPTMYSNPLFGIGDNGGPMRVYHGGPEQITSPRATIDPEGLPEGFSVARTPDIARVYANMRGSNGGVVSEFEINPDQLRTIGEMDYYNFLDDFEMQMGVDRENLTDAEIRNALLNEGYNAIWYPDEDFGIRILDPSILRPVSQTPAQSGVGLLSPSFEEYLSRVNPQGSRIPAEARPNLMMGDMYGMLPDNAKRVGGRDGVQFYEADGDFYATAYNPDVGEMDVVGYAMNRGDMTDLQVVGEMQGSGIGSELQYLYRRANPDAPSGGLTEAGERSLRRTYDRLAQEGLLGKIGD